MYSYGSAILKLKGSIASRPYAYKFSIQNQHPIECEVASGQIRLQAKFWGGEGQRHQTIRFTLDPKDFAALAAAMIKADEAKAVKAFEKATPAAPLG